MMIDAFIIGGGLAGLETARHLHNAGLTWQLTEARSRFGGRILTERLGHGGAEGRFDLGPAWYWPGQDRIAKLVETLGLTAFPQYATGPAVFENQQGQIRRDLDLSLNARALRIDGGMARLIDGLLVQPPRENLCTGCRVKRLSRHGAGWRVTMEGTISNEAIVARHVVFAMPPRLVAETIRFEPSLPDAALTAMTGTPTWMAGHAKAVALYKAPFWRQQGLSGDAISHRGPLAQVHDASPMDGSVGALFGFIGLSAALRQSTGERRLRDHISRQLQRLFASDTPPVRLVVQDWSTEPLTATAHDLTVPAVAPTYGTEPALAALRQQGLHFAATEFDALHGGLLEGALSAAAATAEAITSRRSDRAVPAA